MIHHINKTKKNHMIFSIDAKNLTKFNIYKNSQQSGYGGNIPNITKDICNKCTANIFNGKKLKAFSLRSETRQGCSLWPFLFIILEHSIESPS